MSSSRDAPFSTQVLVSSHSEIQPPPWAQRSVPAPGFIVRGGLALMLSLPEPGLGHLYLGYLKRAAAWFSCQIVVVLATVTGIHF
jgi:hypothetical protein